MPERRADLASAVANGKLYVFGGLSQALTTPLKTVLRYRSGNQRLRPR